MFKRYAEIADQTVSNLVDLAPKMPTPAEYIDAAIQANKLWAKVVEDSLATITKGVYNFK
jgi:flagellar biosynthesis regulator FlaF